MTSRIFRFAAGTVCAAGVLAVSGCSGMNLPGQGGGSESDAAAESGPRTTTVVVTPSEEGEESGKAASAHESESGPEPDKDAAGVTTGAGNRGGKSHGSVKDAYQRVLANPGSVPVNYDNYTPGAFEYALADVNGDGTPEMLLRAGDGDIKPVVVFAAEGTSGEVISTDDVLLDGAATAGGARRAVAADPDGNGIYQYEGMSTSPEQTITKYTLSGSRLSEVGSNVIEHDDPVPGTRLEWSDVSDMSLLDGVVN